MSAVVAQYRPEKNSDTLFILAIAVSFLFHLSVYLILPYLQTSEMSAASAPMRVVVELNTIMQQAVKPEPKPIEPPEVERVLAVDTPDIPSDYEVLVEPEPVIEIVEEIQLVEDVPIVEDIPVVEEVQIIEEAQVVKDEPVVEEIQIVEDVPTVEDTPIVESASLVENTSVTNIQSTSMAPSDAMASGDAVSSTSTWNYGKTLYEMVGRHKKYPQLAIRRNWEGEVKVIAKFTLGKLVDVVLLDSSGHKVLDKEALAMLRKAVERLPVRGDLFGKTFNITVPVDFKLVQQ